MRIKWFIFACIAYVFVVRVKPLGECVHMPSATYVLAAISILFLPPPAIPTAYRGESGGEGPIQRMQGVWGWLRGQEHLQHSVLIRATEVQEVRVRPGRL